MECSPFTHYFLSNYAPNDQEIAAIRAFVAPAFITPYSEELSRLQALIDKLSIERDQLKDYVDAHKALISPVRQIPEDILREIFHACLPTSRNARMSTSDAPLLLGHICRGWRNIVMSTPTLWTSIHIHLDFLTASNQRLAGAMHWLNRTVSSPLSLSLLASRKPLPAFLTSSTVTRYSFITHALLETASRWRHLDLIALELSSLSALSSFAAPALQSIQITSPHDISRLYSLLVGGPELRRVSLHCILPTNILQDTTIPWAQLTHLTLASYSTPHNVHISSQELIFAVIHQCRHLVHLCVEISLGTFTSSDVTELPKLQSFTIRSPFVLQVEEVHTPLHCLRMPNLRHLGLPPLSVLEDGSLLPASFQFVPSSLVSITIDFGSFTLPSLSSLLAAFPHIRRMQIHDRSPRLPQPHTHPYATARTLLPLLSQLSPASRTSKFKPDIFPKL
ncbi:hypothetical protein R3P38DRAFT_2666234 [Favolaschia claudopus]|uniref:F-box domain-containing protein n=1 Tax=Favolaschia claudopus TaxID=2862362 RepID=A0AAV9ZBG0_9AGAR